MKKVITGIIAVCCYLLLPMVITNVFSGEKKIIQDTDYIIGRKINVKLNTVTKTMSLNEFVALVLAGRMEEGDEEEVLKALSIMIRTDICRIMEDSISIDSEALEMEYKTPNMLKAEWGDKYSERYYYLKNICEETQEKIITFEGKAIDAKYTRLSSGETLSGEEILGEDYKYLKPVECKEDTSSSDYISVKVYEAKEWVKLFKSTYKDIGIDEKNPAKDISVIAKTNEGYILKVQVGNMIMTGETFSKIIEADSSCITVEDMDGAVKVVTKGKGSGFGVSLNSANADARSGLECEAIIKKYYSNVEISS